MNSEIYSERGNRNEFEELNQRESPLSILEEKYMKMTRKKRRMRKPMEKVTEEKKPKWI